MESCFDELSLSLKSGVCFFKFIFKVKYLKPGRFISLFFILFVMVNTAQSQDYILNIATESRAVYCDDLVLKDGILNFKEANSRVEKEISMDDVLSIHFHKDKPIEIQTLTLRIDTIVCYIKSINYRMVSYHKENSPLESIHKGDIFCVNYGNQMDNDELQSYVDIFLQMHRKRFVKKPKIIKADGGIIETKDILSINDEKIELELTSKGERANYFINTNLIKSIINKEMSDKKQLKFWENFIFTDVGRFLKIIINDVNEEQVDFNLTVNEKQVRFKQPKKSIIGIFFFNFKQAKEKIIQREKRKTAHSINEAEFNGSILNHNSLTIS